MFSHELSRHDLTTNLRALNNTDHAAVASVLKKSRHSPQHLPSLLSPAAGEHLDEMAFVAERITRRRFGNVMQLYIPLYLSSKCSGSCVYCGFRSSNSIQRTTLSFEEAMAEGLELRKMGFQNILLVAGVTDDLFRENYLQRLVSRFSAWFASVSIEIEDLTESVYRELRNANLDGVTLYQETYNRDTFTAMHPGGKKSDFDGRLNAMDRVAAAGIRKMGIGALLGLHDFREEGLAIGRHVQYLLKHYWRSAVAVSFPRLRESEAGMKAPCPASDRELAQMVFAFRIVFPDIDLVLSTREPPELRDLLAGIAITYMSAGSRTSPGAYTLAQPSGRQFELEDTRPVPEICKALRAKGLDVVWKDWNEYVELQGIS